LKKNKKAPKKKSAGKWPNDVPGVGSIRKVGGGGDPKGAAVWGKPRIVVKGLQERRVKKGGDQLPPTKKITPMNLKQKK